VRRPAIALAVLVVVAGVVAFALHDDEPAPPPARTTTTPQQEANGPAWPRIAWRRSRAVGAPNDGRLVRGVQLPAEGPDWFTWDPVLERIPNRAWRRWGTDRLVHTLLRVLREYRAAHPEAPRVGVADLSRPHGRGFGPRYGGLGHASHQNGLDADVWYPRADRTERRAMRVPEVDRGLSQALVDAFVGAGAQKLYVGPDVGLRGPKGVVVPLVHHDDHVHVRIAPPPA